jgi:hypothetical protein
MAARRLNTYVHVHIDGTSSVFGPDDKVPADVAKLITNDAVWADEASTDEPEVIEPTPALPEGVAATPTDVVAAAADDSVPPPPKSGAGSGTEAWRKYADAKGFEVDSDASRQEIIDTLAAAGVATE